MSRSLKRWWWLLLGVLVLAGLWRLRFDVDVLDLLPPNQPAVQGLKLYEKYFANARELVVSVGASDAEQAERFAGALAARLRLATNLIASVSWQPPWLEQPGQMAELVACLWFNQPPNHFAELGRRLAPGQLELTLAGAKEILATSLSPMDIARRAFDPYDLLSLPALTDAGGFSADQAQKMFASPDGSFRVIFVQARPDLTSYRSCSRWLKSVKTIVDSVQVGPGEGNAPTPGQTGGEPAGGDPARQPLSGKPDSSVVIRYTGRPAFVTEIAAGMQRDLSGSVAGTAAIIALLFWLTHRRWKPMLWLLLLLALILMATLALGGLLLGTINVVSMGFAAVLLGLAVDYAVVHYQEALAHPTMTIPEIRRAIAPSILWAAITTISAFLVLNFGGLPGLAQLGSLVAIGIALSALVMVVAFLPPLFPERRGAAARDAASPFPWWSFLIPPQAMGERPVVPADQAYARRSVWLAGLVLVCAGAVLCLHRPGLDQTANALRPQHSEAEMALEEITAAMGLPKEPLWLIIPGRDEAAVYRRLSASKALLDRAVSNRCVAGYLLPGALWPRVEHQESNRATARLLGSKGPLLRQAALEQGFNTNALLLTEELVHSWAQFGAAGGVAWPTNEMSQWILKRFVARTTNDWLALGLIYPATNRVEQAAMLELSSQLLQVHAWLSGWQLLGRTTLQQVRGRLWQLVLPMVALVLTSLWLAFRRVAELLLGLAVLGLSGVCLLATMALAGWSWNLLNLMAVPLMLGTGVDYGIFMALALRRHRGDLGAVRRSVGRALLLCGGTAVAGFGSLAWSSNAGMASLGKVCAVGIGTNMLIAVYLLPGWWCRACGQPQPGSPADSAPARAQSHPSVFYQAWLWHLGLGVVRLLPPVVLKQICLATAEVYYLVDRQRRKVVVQNLLPAVGGDTAAATAATRRLFRQFALKLLDLWRFENGVAVNTWFHQTIGFEILEAARARGKGVLLITMHVGNWEIGGPLLAQRGVRLIVISQSEPGDDLTRLRLDSRAKWNIETLVVGKDAFAFVEVIKRLQDGAVVAILLDRPLASGTVSVDLFGRPFPASISAAELARASGCALVGVTIVRAESGYVVRTLPEFHYERQRLGNPEARRELTQQVLRAFEPVLRQYPDQWFHFVPVWPEDP